MVQDKKGLLWCSTNKGIFRLNKDNSIFLLKKEDGLQENEFNTNVVATAEDGEVFFGGINGVSSFYPEHMTGFDENINLLFTNIRINNIEAFTDTAVWNIKDIVLPYDKNLLSFDFAARGDNTPAQYIYQYRMKGIDDAWLQNDGLQTVRYLLPPGTYDMEIYASRFFDKDAKPLRSIHIVIRSPFWKTWWFLSCIIIFLLALVAYFINNYNRRKFRKKLHVLRNEQRLQKERERISRDLHDNIGAYANAVLYKTDLLQKEEYTAQDCLLRIRNFIQPFNRYYEHIHFTVTGDAPDATLHYTTALNAVRIVQEAVTNAIKHAAATAISVSSTAENGLWIITVTDNGKGFDYHATKMLQQGNGLENMKQRADESNFELSVTSIPGKGTATAIHLKL